MLYSPPRCPRTGCSSSWWVLLQAEKREVYFPPVHNKIQAIFIGLIIIHNPAPSYDNEVTRPAVIRHSTNHRRVRRHIRGGISLSHKGYQQRLLEDTKPCTHNDLERQGAEPQAYPPHCTHPKMAKRPTPSSSPFLPAPPPMGAQDTLHAAL